MENSVLIQQLKLLQKDYGMLLKSIAEDLYFESFPLVMDEISIFWHRNRDLIRLILRYILSNKNCYVFTGATFLDIDDLEHFPFITLGDMHLIDDPLCKYAGFIGKFYNGEISEDLKNQIVLSVQDNIKIIDKYADLIYILPITLLEDIDNELIQSASKQAIFSMFKNDTSLTMEKYFATYKRIEEVAIALNDEVKETIIFSENDNLELDFIYRFKEHISAIPLSFPNASEAEIFFNIMNGFFLQAISILLTCAEYQMIPYIRYNVCFYYVISFCKILPKDVLMQEILFKCLCAHILYRNFDKNRVKNIDFIAYYTKLKEKNFSKELFDYLGKEGFDFNTATPGIIAPIIEEKIKTFIDNSLKAG